MTPKPTNKPTIEPCEPLVLSEDEKQRFRLATNIPPAEDRYYD